MNINSSSYYSVSGSNNSSTTRGLTGLASGIDTESMVEQMLSGTQGKIDAQQALKQQTLWKQEIYREIITSINAFRDKYFDISYGASLSTNFASDSFFNVMLSSIKSGSGVNVISSSSSAMAGDMDVVVKQLASSAKLAGSSGALGGDKTIRGAELTEEHLKNFDKTVSLQVDGSEVVVDLNSVSSETEMVDAFNTALQDKGITVSVNENGQLHFEGNAGTKISVSEDSSELGLAMSGLTSLVSKEEGSSLTGGEIQIDAGITFTLTLDGVQKSITVSKVAGADGKVTADSLKDAVATQVKKAFGDYIEVGLENNALTFKVNFKNQSGEEEAGHQLTITGVDANKLGIKPGSTTQLSMVTKLSEMGLEGDRFSFEINGTSFTFSGEDTIGSVINKINSSDAGVRLSYSSISDSFTIEASSTGKGYGIEMNQLEGNLLTKLFGEEIIDSSTSVTGSAVNLTTGSLTSTGLKDDYTTTGATLAIKVNGKDYTFTLAKKADGSEYTKDEVEKELNSWLESTFGTAEDRTANISYRDGTLETKAGFVVEIAKSDADLSDPDKIDLAGKTDLGVALGFAIDGASNAVTDQTKLSDIAELKDLAASFSKDGVDTADLTLADLKGDGMKLTLRDSTGGDVQVAVTYFDGRLTLANAEGKTINFKDNPGLGNFFSGDSITFGDGRLKGRVQAGTDAIVEINGVETTRTSNTFTIDGITMELTEVSKQLDDGSYEKTVISTSRDVDAIVEGFKSFVEDYNALIEKLNGYVNADPEYKEYAPLTTEQKKEMSEREIELWEERAKTGLIRRDDAVESFLSQMRMALYTKPAGAKYALYDIGIETGDYRENGKLELDEAALRNALSTDPSAVQQLFMDTEQGLSKQLMDIIDRTAKETGGSNAGTLVQLAGVKGTSSEKSNTLYSQLQDIEDRIEELQRKYELERTRYWNQFNSMETILSNYNTQSMWLSQQFG